ncbi:hypothetical protein N8D56_26540 (plasmid) [Devosia sp. A8/3-2]|nr:hypothetical protein N8D56_26540 [Devosia sp. A8/3-2]
MLAKPIAALVFALALAAPALAEDQVVDVYRDDAQMNAAMDKARCVARLLGAFC